MSDVRFWKEVVEENLISGGTFEGASSTYRAFQHAILFIFIRDGLFIPLIKSLYKLQSTPCTSKVLRDDSNGQGRHKHAGNSAYWPDSIAIGRGGVNVSVAHRRHGYYGPPKAGVDVGEVVRIGSLRIVDQRGAYNHASQEYDPKDANLPETLPQRKQ